MNSKVIIICESVYHGNTKKIADAMAAILKCEVINCDQAKQKDLGRYEAVLLGSGIYFTSHHPKLLELTEKLHKSQKIIIFSTRGCPVVGKYHQALKTKLNEHGLSTIGEFSCKGFDETGPYNLTHGGNKGKPNEGDCYRAQRYVKKILSEYVPAPVKCSGAVTIDASRCIGCGLCQKNCLMNVFEKKGDQMSVVCEENCVHCGKCTEVCPQGCIGIYHTKHQLLGIAKKFSKRTSL